MDATGNVCECALTGEANFAATRFSDRKSPAAREIPCVVLRTSHRISASATENATIGRILVLRGDGSDRALEKKIVNFVTAGYILRKEIPLVKTCGVSCINHRMRQLLQRMRKVSRGAYVICLSALCICFLRNTISASGRFPPTPQFCSSNFLLFARSSANLNPTRQRSFKDGAEIIASLAENRARALLSRVAVVASLVTLGKVVIAHPIVVTSFTFFSEHLSCTLSSCAIVSRVRRRGTEHKPRIVVALLYES